MLAKVFFCLLFDKNFRCVCPLQGASWDSINNNIFDQEDHVSNVQDHVLIEEHQVLDFVDHVLKVK
jgi:hypothetical protein